MMRFTTFQEIQLKPGMRDIGDCRWAKSAPIATPLHAKGIYLGVSATENTPSTHVS